LRLKALEKLARLYWYTVEFGLIAESGGLRLYGAGILSSFGESRFALEDSSPNRLTFDLMRVMRTRYRIDDYQQSYFVIDKFDQLLHQTRDADFTPLYRELETLPDLAPDAVIPSDQIVSRGSQKHAYRGKFQ
jgi:phenylalanine-4-hydroxylase